MSERTFFRPLGVLLTPARNRCIHCGTLRHAHAEDGACPVFYRPDNLDDARTALVDAIESGDQGRIFVARGDLQRLQGRQ